MHSMTLHESIAVGSRAADVLTPISNFRRAKALSFVQSSRLNYCVTDVANPHWSLQRKFFCHATYLPQILAQNPAQFAAHQTGPLVPQERQPGAGPVQLIQIDFLRDQRFVEVEPVCHELAIGIDD